jgi:hypothetical protein
MRTHIQQTKTPKGFYYNSHGCEPMDELHQNKKRCKYQISMEYLPDMHRKAGKLDYRPETSIQ